MKKNLVDFKKPSQTKLLQIKKFVITEYAKNIEKGMKLSDNEALKFSKSSINKHLDGTPDETNLFLVYDTCQNIEIGYVWFNINGEWLYLSDIFIKKKYRGNGFGTAIIDKITNDNKGKFKYFNFHVFHFNKKAMKFYLKNGFSITGSQMIKHYK